MAEKRAENIWLNLGFNMVLPIMLLTKGTKWFDIDPTTNLIIALALPLGYGIYDAIAQHKLNFLSVLGFVSILIKGSIGLLKGSVAMVAINEAALPLIIGIAVLVTLKTKRPLVKEFLYNEQIFDVSRIRSELETRKNEEAFNKLLRTCTFLLALSFLISSILNYLMAKIYVHTPPAVNLEAFNAEVGAMQGWSYLFIVLPTSIVTMAALILLIRGIKKLTGLSLEEAMKQQPGKN
jgi:intracellular septation protein A